MVRSETDQKGTDGPGPSARLPIVPAAGSPAVPMAMLQLPPFSQHKLSHFDLFFEVTLKGDPLQKFPL